MTADKKEPQTISFRSAADWEKWLERHHLRIEGIWLKFFKKGSGVKTVTYDEALDVALCYGWIDGQTKSLDEKAYLQKFTPRRKRSMWSKRNREHVARLIKEGRMRPSGLMEIEGAKRDGRWESAYDSPGKMEIPQDFLKELSKNKKAEDFFGTLSKANTYAIAWRLQTAKRPETRERRMKEILGKLKRGEKFH